MRNDKEVTTVRLNKELKGYTKIKAEENGMSLSSYLEKVIENGVSGVTYNDNRTYNITNNYGYDYREERCIDIDFEE
ncbi:hypothetical protein [Clostridium sp.]|uniref:hypothetical protein n=1 Tax=Clostridium sp. TaxID=1506 RepID=UPI003995F2C2